MNKNAILYLMIFICSCRKNAGNDQKIYLINKSTEDIYYVLSKDDTIAYTQSIKEIRPKTSEMKFNENTFVIYESKEDSLIARDNDMFPFRIKCGNTKQIFESMSADMIANAISIQQRINIDFNGKLNVFIINANDLKSFSDKKIVKNKLYKKVHTFTEKDIVSDSILIEYLGK